MDTGTYQTLSFAALAGFLVAGSLVLSRTPRGARPHAWIAPAALAALLSGWTIVAVVGEGPIGFWPHHMRDAWGVQIWMDLLLCAGVAFALLAPRARAVGMRPLVWFALIATSGSIGLLLMLARYLFLSRREPASESAAVRV